jgi:catechol 2,3-dioxygenase-like lactoylglutathione lyase family enzyme
MPVTFNHVGTCVTDLGRSLRFYEWLGFEHLAERDITPPDTATSRLLDIEPPVGLTAVYLRLDGFVLELLHYDRPLNPPAVVRAMNEPGLTHLSLTVDDLAGALQQVESHGGAIVESSSIGIAVMIRDPDGQLIELIAKR